MGLSIMKGSIPRNGNTHEHMVSNEFFLIITLSLGLAELWETQTGGNRQVVDADFWDVIYQQLFRDLRTK